MAGGRRRRSDPGGQGPEAQGQPAKPLQSLGESLLATRRPSGSRTGDRPAEVLRPEADAPRESEAAGVGSRDAESKTTRDRILDVALDLFTEKGYDQTSLREIAEQLGFTKAALYYHFSSKDEIFMALHVRLHEMTAGSVGLLTDEVVTIDSWKALLDLFIEKIPANRKLIAMHERNRTAFEKLHHEDHAREHEDLEEKLRGALSNPGVPLRDRIRMACAFAAVMGGLVFGGETFADADSDQLVVELKAAVHDLLE